MIVPITSILGVESKKFNAKLGLTKVAHTSRTANTVNVFLNVTGQIKVNNVLHVADIQTSGSHLNKRKQKISNRQILHSQFFPLVRDPNF